MKFKSYRLKRSRNSVISSKGNINNNLILQANSFSAEDYAAIMKAFEKFIADAESQKEVEEDEE